MVGHLSIVELAVCCTVFTRVGCASFMIILTLKLELLETDSIPAL